MLLYSHILNTNTRYPYIHACDSVADMKEKAISMESLDKIIEKSYQSCC